MLSEWSVAVWNSAEQNQINKAAKTGASNQFTL
jgi:hypothetical protein